MNRVRAMTVGRYAQTPLGVGRKLSVGDREFLEVKDGPFFALYERLEDGSFRKIGEFRRSYDAHRRAFEEAAR